jgi:hypothetical protein
MSCPDGGFPIVGRFSRRPCATRKKIYSFPKKSGRATHQMDIYSLGDQFRRGLHELVLGLSSCAPACSLMAQRDRSGRSIVARQMIQGDWELIGGFT